MVNMNTTMKTLESVRVKVLENLSAYEAIGYGPDDLDQEIYRVTLELMAKAESLDDLIDKVLVRIKRSVRMRPTTVKTAEDEIDEHVAAIQAAVFAGYRAKSIQYQRDQERKRAKNAVEDLLESCLTEEEEAVVRLKCGIPTAEMVDTIGVVPNRQYHVNEIATLLGLGTSRYSGMVRVNEMLMHAMRTLRLNGKAFYLYHK